jgi:hypothetical protein
LIVFCESTNLTIEVAYIKDTISAICDARITKIVEIILLGENGTESYTLGSEI